MTSRVLVVILALAVGGVHSAHAQPPGHPAAEPGPAGSDADEEQSTGAGTAVVAPTDPKARPAWLRDQLTRAIAGKPALGKARIGAYVVDLGTGQELFAHDADTGLSIASNAKLLTTIAALATLGGGFQWRTSVLADDLDDATGTVKGNLYLRGKGDPTLTAADLQQLAADVAARGVRTVEGQLVVDTSYFDGNVEPPHFGDQPAERAGFRAPVASLGVARGAVTVTVVPVPGGNAEVHLDPDASEYVRLRKVDVKTVTDKRTRILITVQGIEVKPDGRRIAIDVTGQIRVADGSYSQRRRVDDPARLATDVFRAALAAHGVKLAHKGSTSGAVPAAATLVAQHESANLASVIRDMNKHSDNYLAESVFKTLGAETRATPGPGTWADAKAAVAAAIAREGVAAGSYRADNGSGLYDATSVSAKQLVTLLGAAYHDFRIGPDLVASLPVGGVDGTLARRWTKSAAKGRVRAKTGTLDKVISIAGYVAVDDAHQIAFAILANDIPPGQRGAARALGDEMVEALLAYLGQ